MMRVLVTLFVVTRPVACEMFRARRNKTEGDTSGLRPLQHDPRRVEFRLRTTACFATGTPFMSIQTTVRTLALLTAALCSLDARAEFRLQEATVDSLHKAIQTGEITCKQVIEAYVARARAYNG